MKRISRFSLLMPGLVIAFAITTYAQGPMLKQVNFSINTPYALQVGEYLLPAGNYVLHQVLQNDPNLFALHPQDLSKEPIAMIRTVRVSFPPASLPEDTKIFVEIDEGTPNAHPVVQGWTIPGSDGWEVIGVVEKKKGLLTKLDSSKKYKLDKGKASFTKYETSDKRSKIQFKKID